ncbi:MAG: hypothetical protein P4L60_21710 [Clostridium sp.]|nr:hypothetical protein [Clostridium sp.]
MIRFEMCKFEEIKEKVYKYYKENDILVYSFWEKHALESNCYNIIFNEEIIEYCGIYNKGLITLFNLGKNTII